MYQMKIHSLYYLFNPNNNGKDRRGNYKVINKVVAILISSIRIINHRTKLQQYCSMQSLRPAISSESESDHSSTPLPFIRGTETTTPISQSVNDIPQSGMQSQFGFLAFVRKICCFWQYLLKHPQEQDQKIYVAENSGDLVELIMDIESQQIEPAITSPPTHLKTLVLDLDETLVHTKFQQRQCQYSSFIQINNCRSYFYTNRRPGAVEFIKQMSRYYEIVVFTAGLKEYAEKILEFIDPESIIKHILYRKHCIQINNRYIKNLRLVNRGLKDIVLVDNNPYSGLLQPDNLLLVRSYNSQQNDKELFNLIDLLKSLAQFEDVRSVQKHRQRYFEKSNNKENNSQHYRKVPTLQKRSSSNEHFKESNKLQHIR